MSIDPAALRPHLRIVPDRTLSLGAGAAHADSVSATSASATSTLIGRDLLIRDAATRLAAGAGTLVIGEAGIGKTALLRAIAATAEADGRRVGRITATSAMAALPFGVLLALLDERGSDLSTSSAQMDPLRTAALVRARVLGLDLQVLAVDDAHLLDAGSAAFIAELAQIGVAVVLTARSDREFEPSLRALRLSGAVVRCALNGLTPAEIALLATRLLGGPCDSALGLTLHRSGAGNPLVATELLRTGLADGSIEQASGIWVANDALPALPDLLDLMGIRIDRLSPTVRAFVEAVAIAELVPLDVALLLADESTIDAAEAAGWIAVDLIANAIHMRQPLYGDAVQAHTGSMRRRNRLHRLIQSLGSLSRPLSPIERVAIARWRLDTGEPLGVEEAMAVASITSVSDPRVAERFLRAAVAEGGGARSEVRLAAQLKRSGREREAETLLGRTDFDTVDPKTAEEVTVLLAIVVGIGFRRSREALQALEGRLEGRTPTPGQTAVRAALLWREGRLPEALPLVTAVAEIADGSFASVFGGINQSLMLASGGDRTAALQRVERLRSLVPLALDSVPEGPVTLDWLVSYIPLVTELDREQAEKIAQRRYDRFLAEGNDAARAQFSFALAYCHLLAGRPATAATLLRETDAAPGIWRDSWRPAVLARLVECLAVSGDIESAEVHALHLEGLHRSPMHMAAVDLAEAAVAAGRGDLTESRRLTALAAHRAKRSGDMVGQFDALYAGVRYGDLAAASALAAFGTTPSGAARALQQQHAAAVRAGSADDLIRVASRFEAIGLYWYAVEARAAAVGALRGASRTPQAVLERERLRARLAARPELRFADKFGQTAPHLTGREAEVARAAAQGLTDTAIADRLAISVRTVQTHLTRAYGKLGIAGRGELAALLDGAPVVSGR